MLCYYECGSYDGPPPPLWLGLLIAALFLLAFAGGLIGAIDHMSKP